MSGHMEGLSREDMIEAIRQGVHDAVFHLLTGYNEYPISFDNVMHSVEKAIREGVVEASENRHRVKP